MTDSNNFPEQLSYSREDEWAKIADDKVTVGITYYAQEQLGDIVFVELPQPGTLLVSQEVFGVIESVKAVSDLFAPISGEVLEVNHALVDHPELVNENCYEQGWMLIVQVADNTQLENLLTAAQYRTLLADRAEN